MEKKEQSSQSETDIYSSYSTFLSSEEVQRTVADSVKITSFQKKKFVKGLLYFCLPTCTAASILTPTLFQLASKAICSSPPPAPNYITEVIARFVFAGLAFAGSYFLGPSFRWQRKLSEARPNALVLNEYMMDTSFERIIDDALDSAPERVPKKVVKAHKGLQAYNKKYALK